MLENWKSIKDYPWIYVSDLGNVKTIERPSLDNKKIIKGRSVKPAISQGYRYIIARKNLDEKYKKIKVSRLVAQAFIGHSKLQVDHINKNRLDDRLENLQYVTNRENTSRVKNSYDERNMYYNKKRDRWEVRFFLNGKRVKVCQLKDKNEAIKRRDNFIKENKLCYVRKSIY